MKRIFIILSSLLVICACSKSTARDAVINFLEEYKNLSANVISSLDSVVEEENLTEEQKDIYRSILKRQYQDLEYEIVKETVEEEDTLVEVNITVYDLNKVQEEASSYLEENSSLFYSDGVFDNSLYMDYKLKKMSEVNDRIEYTITFKVSRDEDNNYQVVDVSEDDLKKIHGIY